MILYHFTALEYLVGILREGLTRGEVPITPTLLLNAVWLTSNGSAAGHGLTDGRELTEQEKRLKGIPLGAAARFPDKRAVRITIKINTSDRCLDRWSPWARGRLSREWRDTLNQVGGGKAATWWLYHGVIPPERFLEIRDLRRDRCAVPSPGVSLAQAVSQW